jgi:hypothetical protein
VTLSALRERARGGRARLLAVAAAASAAAVVWAAGGGDLGNAALRALGAVALLGAAAVAIRRRPAPLVGGPLRVEARHALGRDSGVALLDVAGQRLLVGFGPAGVSLLADLGAREPR